MIWEQNYDPLGSRVLSTAAAALPVVAMLGLLGVFHVAAHRAALVGLAVAMLVAKLAYAMPTHALLAAAGYGAAFGLFPIGWLLLGALFLYNLTVRTGRFEIIKASVAGLSPDRRVQAVLIAFCFGAFLEGAAGFGFPVAICAALLMGLGFRPIEAAGLALIANTSPVAFGSLGTPVITLAGVTADRPEQQEALAELYARMAGRQLPFFSLLVPIWLVAVMGGWRAVRGIWPVLLVAGGSFALFQHLIAEHHGPKLVDILAGLASLLATAALLRLWQPTDDPEFLGPPPAEVRDSEAGVPGSDAGEAGPTGTADSAAPPTENRASTEAPPTTEGPPRFSAGQQPTANDQQPPPRISAGQQPTANDQQPPSSPQTPNPEAQPLPPQPLTARTLLSAWGPWLLMTAAILLASVPTVNQPLERATLTVSVPALHQRIAPGPEVRPLGQSVEAAADKAKAEFRLNLLTATGTLLFAVAALASLWMGVGVGQFATTFVETVGQLRNSLITIAAMLALGFVTKHSGLDVTLGLAYTFTGAAYPFFSPMLGWLGVALTGSDTSSNVLFGNLQKVTAHGLVEQGVLPLDRDSAAVLLCTSNSTGGVMGKMIDAQSIVVAAAATGRHDDTGAILRFVFWHSLALAGLMGLLVLVQAYWLTGMIPSAN